jgi:integrase
MKNQSDRSAGQFGSRAARSCFGIVEALFGLGHSTISTTADIYAHITPAMLERTADRMDGILGRKVETA